MLDVNPLSGPGGAPASFAKPDATAVEKEDFLKLLVAQISNQDPLAPKDSDSFMEQLTQFSQLEQMMNMNQGVTTLNLGQLSSNSQQAVGFVGQTVLANGDSVELGEAGGTNVVYSVHGEAETVTIKIRDESGEVVHEGTVVAPPEGEELEYAWNGMLDANGERRAAPGRYTVEIAAVDANESPVAVETLIQGVVDSVRFDKGYPELMIGGRRVMMSDVREVRGALE